jgi:hypothetical protein
MECVWELPSVVLQGHASPTANLLQASKPFTSMLDVCCWHMGLTHIMCGVISIL